MTAATSPISVLLVDPSRFTVPYDAGLTEGLLANGVNVLWATRPLRSGEHEELPVDRVLAIFYRRFDRPKSVLRSLRGPLKALSHVVGLCRLVGTAFRRQVDIVHFQWAVLPIFDTVAIAILKCHCPVIITVHDTVPFNGEKITYFQSLGFDLPIRFADRVIVHTQAAKQALASRGIAADKIHIVAHGPLHLRVPIPKSRPRDVNDPWIFTLFGQMKPYKGIDVLLEAIGQIAPDIRGRARFIVAGAAHMDMEPAKASIRRLEIEDLVDLRIGRLNEEDVAILFEATDCFVFPYRQIDASGVYFLTKPLGKWMIASRVGVFAEDIADGQTGVLIAPGNPARLAAAIRQVTTTRPAPSEDERNADWTKIGEETLKTYTID